MHKGSGNSRKSVNWAPRILIISVLICLGAVLAYLAGELGDRKVKKELADSQQTNGSAENFVSTEADDTKEITVDGVRYRLRPGMERVLIMGVDDPGTQESTKSYMNTEQADFLLLLAVDHGSGSYKSLMINRDTICKVPVLDITGSLAYWDEAQIALAHTYGTGRQDSCVNQCLAVSELLYETPIDHYISLSMPVIGAANDAVGGVTVTIEDDFGGKQGLDQGAEVTLNAAQAELFVRGRQSVSDQTNLNRMARQRTYMSAWKKLAQEKMKSDSGFFMTLLGMVSDYMVSDMQADKLSDLATQLTDYRDEGVSELKGAAQKGAVYMEFYPTESELRATVLDMFYEPVETAN